MVALVGRSFVNGPLSKRVQSGINLSPKMTTAGLYSGSSLKEGRAIFQSIGDIERNFTLRNGVDNTHTSTPQPGHASKPS